MRTKLILVRGLLSYHSFLAVFHAVTPISLYFFFSKLLLALKLETPLGGIFLLLAASGISNVSLLQWSTVDALNFNQAVLMSNLAQHYF